MHHHELLIHEKDLKVMDQSLHLHILKNIYPTLREIDLQLFAMLLGLILSKNGYIFSHI